MQKENPNWDTSPFNEMNFIQEDIFFGNPKLSQKFGRNKGYWWG